MSPDEQLVDAKYIAKRFGVSTRHVHRLGLTPVRLSARCIRFRKSEVDALVEARTAC